jgi:hypothetical protein
MKNIILSALIAFSSMSYSEEVQEIEPTLLYVSERAVFIASMLRIKYSSLYDVRAINSEKYAQISRHLVQAEVFATTSIKKGGSEYEYGKAKEMLIQLEAIYKEYMRDMREA